VKDAIRLPDGLVSAGIAVEMTLGRSGD